jgi:hypothetical protein
VLHKTTIWRQLVEAGAIRRRAATLFDPFTFALIQEIPLSLRSSPCLRPEESPCNRRLLITRAPMGAARHRSQPHCCLCTPFEPYQILHARLGYIKKPSCSLSGCEYPESWVSVGRSVGRSVGERGEVRRLGKGKGGEFGRARMRPDYCCCNIEIYGSEFD